MPNRHSWDNPRQEKTRIRRRMAHKRSSHSLRDRVSCDRRIGTLLQQWVGYQKARHIGWYASFGSEAATWVHIRKARLEGRQAYLPRVRGNHLEFIPVHWSGVTPINLQDGYRGIQEPKGRPVELDMLDLVVVPGLAFDHNGYRLGYGGGFYDRFLENLPPKTVSVGLCYSFQRVRQLPREDHDVPVRYVLTEASVNPVYRSHPWPVDDFCR